MGLDQFMRKCVTLQRLNPIKGRTAGQTAPGYVTDPDADDVPCDIQPASASTRIRYMQNNMSVSHTLYFKEDYDPNTRDRWVYEANGRVRHFIVHGWYNSLEAGETWVCDCEEVKVPQV